MKMDENINPEWVAQCKGSSSGRKALDEIERLNEKLSIEEHAYDILATDNEALLGCIAKLEAVQAAAVDYSEVDHVSGISLYKAQAALREALKETK